MHLRVYSILATYLLLIFVDSLFADGIGLYCVYLITTKPYTPSVWFGRDEINHTLGVYGLDVISVRCQLSCSGQVAVRIHKPLHGSGKFCSNE